MTPPYDYSVFINCPFDADYRPMLYAITFAVHDCGFKARCTLEIDDAGRVRMDSILDLIFGATRFGEGEQEDKRCLILDRESYRYQILDVKQIQYERTSRTTQIRPQVVNVKKC